MNRLLQELNHKRKRKEKSLAILIDPDKTSIEMLPALFEKIEAIGACYVFIGGSSVSENQAKLITESIKEYAKIPCILFPGDYTHINEKADALLFLSLLSGRNPEFLIGQQVKAIPSLESSSLEIIPTGYLLIDGGTKSAVERVSRTSPIARTNIKEVLHTSIAGMYSGKQLIYLEAGSGAIHPISTKIIRTVRSKLEIPLIVGGGINSMQKVFKAFDAGADVVVIGTAFENDSFNY